MMTILAALAAALISVGECEFLASFKLTGLYNNYVLALKILMK